MKKLLVCLLCLAMCLQGLGVSAQYIAPPGETILTKHLGFQRVVGIVVGEKGDELTVVITKTHTNDTDDFKVGECITFEAIHKKSDNILGYRIDAYVKSNGEKNIIIAGDNDNGRNSEVVLKTDMIVELTPEKVIYKDKVNEDLTELAIQSFVEINSEESVKVNSNVVVNGELNSGFNVYEEYKTLNEITFVDNDKDGIFEFIIVNTEK